MDTTTTQPTSTEPAKVDEKAQELIKRARVQLLLKQPFFGSLALRLTILEAPSITPTMATDGTHLIYNPEYVKTLTLSQTIGVICHEVLHCANRHHARQGSRHTVVWNYACDYVINPHIKAAQDDIGGELPADVLLDPKYDGWGAERVYDDLLDSGKIKIVKVKASPGDGTPQDGQGQGQAVDGKTDKPLKPKVGEVLPCRGGEEKEQEEGWTVATRQAAQAAKMQGKLPASIAGMIGDMVDPQVDWKSLLWEFVQTVTDASDYTWTRPSHRYMARGLYLPTMYGETCPAIGITIDTSGSVSDKELSAFISEIKCIVDTVKPERIYLMDCDAQVSKCRIYERGDEFAPEGKLKVYGRGGTDFRPPFLYAAKHQFDMACMIYLTDLEGPFPEKSPVYPTLWVSTQRHHTAPFGQTIHLDVRGV